MSTYYKYIVGLCISQNKQYMWNKCRNGLELGMDVSKHYLCASSEVYTTCIMV